VGVGARIVRREEIEKKSEIVVVIVPVVVEVERDGRVGVGVGKERRVVAAGGVGAGVERDERRVGVGVGRGVKREDRRVTVDEVEVVVGELVRTIRTKNVNEGPCLQKTRGRQKSKKIHRSP